MKIITNTILFAGPSITLHFLKVALELRNLSIQPVFFTFTFTKNQMVSFWICGVVQWPFHLNLDIGP